MTMVLPRITAGAISDTKPNKGNSSGQAMPMGPEPWTVRKKKKIDLVRWGDKAHVFSKLFNEAYRRARGSSLSRRREWFPAPCRQTCRRRHPSRRGAQWKRRPLRVENEGVMEKRECIRLCPKKKTNKLVNETSSKFKDQISHLLVGFLNALASHG